MASQPATQPAEQAASVGIDLGSQLKRKYGVGPSNWDRFKAAADSPDAAERALVPASGAHVTLADLARPASSITPLPDFDDPAVRAALESDVGWVGTPDPAKYRPDTQYLTPKQVEEEVKKGNVMLWKDFKDWAYNLKGEEREAVEQLLTVYLMKEKFFHTLPDGSKVSMWDLQQYVENNPELEALYRSGRSVPTADPLDPAGRPLGRAGLRPAELAERGLVTGDGVAVVTPEEARELEHDWGMLGTGSVWRRRPTRWLRGLDGLKDWEVEVYAHEPLANQILGRKYGNRDAYGVLRDESYAKDVLRCGPLLGTTFILRAARDLPLREAASTWRGLLSSYLQRQTPLTLPRMLRPVPFDPTDIDGVHWPELFRPEVHQALLQQEGEAGLREREAASDPLGASWRVQEPEEHAASVASGKQLLESLPDLLCPRSEPPSAWPLSSTALVDARGDTWRKGASVWLTLGPGGQMVVQGQSPVPGTPGGAVPATQAQESYLLAQLEDQEALVGAVMEAALGPSPLDPDMAAQARSMLLLPVYGHTVDNKEMDPNHPLRDVPRPRLPRILPDPSAFMLPPACVSKGAGREQQREGTAGGSMVLSGLGDACAYTRVAQIAQEVSQAADAAAASAGGAQGASDAAEGQREHEGGSGAEEDVRARARQAAMEVAQRGLQELAGNPRAVWALAGVLEEMGMPVEQMGVPVAQGQGAGGRAADLFSLARGLEGVEEEVAGRGQ